MTSESREISFEVGLNLLASDKFAEAAELFSCVLAIDPNNAESLQKRSEAFFYNAEFEKALTDIDAAIASAPDNAELYLDRYRLRTLLDSMAENLEDIETALKLDPNSARGYTNLAVYWSNHFDFEKMEKAVKQALQIDSNYYGALVNQSSIFDVKNKRKESVRFIDFACKILEKDLIEGKRDFFRLAYYYSVLRTQKKFELALEVCNEGIRRFPKLPYFYGDRGYIQTQLSQPDRLAAAEADFETATKITDKFCIKNHQILLDRVNLLFQQGNDDHALELTKKMLAWMPDNPFLLQYYLLSMLQKNLLDGNEKNNLDIMLEKANRLCQLLPTYYDAFSLRSQIYLRKGNRLEAENDFDTAMLFLPETPERTFDAASIANELGRYKTACDLYSRILQNEQNRTNILFLRGWSWYSLGIYDCAYKDFSKALQLRSEPNAMFLHGRAASLAEMGTNSFTCSYFRKSIADYTKALELDPTQSNFWYGRGVAWFRIARRAWFGTKQNLQNSIDDYSEAIRLEPEEADFLYARALSYWFRLDWEAVINDCSTILQIKPNHIDALRLRAQTYQRRGDIEKSHENYLTLEKN